jgi:hypothetical protein
VDTIVARRLNVNSMSYIEVGTLGGEPIVPVSSVFNSDAIDKSRSRATQRLCRKTMFREGVWPVKKVANGRRESADKTPNDHVFFVVALFED